MSVQSLHAKQSTILRPALVVLALFAIAGYFARDAVLGTPVQGLVATRSDFVKTVVASGRVMTPRRVSIGALITGRVVTIPVEEGQRVKRGQVLIVLDGDDERAAAAQARAALAQAEARLRQMREVTLPAARQSVVQAQANLRQARLQFERTNQLKARGFLSDAALDDAKRNLDVAESQAQAALLQVQTNSSGGSDELMAKTARDQALATLTASAVRVEQTVIRASIDGTLIARNVEAGDVVQPGKELMVLAPAGESQIVVQVDEKNLAQLKLGQNALASADAFPRDRFAVQLIYINPGVDASRGAVEVKLRVPDAPRYILQDMTVSVEIEVGRRANTIVVEASAVRDADSDHPWTLAIEGHRAVRRPVVIGLRGEGKMEILSGISAGDLLISSVDSGISPGRRVRAIKADARSGT